MKILIACECSGVVRRAFRALGHDAWSCDLLPADDGSPFHIQGEALDALKLRKWDLVIAHPPCTYLCNSAVFRLDGDVARQIKMAESAQFFRAFWIRYTGALCVENPIMHRYAKEAIAIRLPKPQYVQPYQFGDDASKRTGLYLRGLPQLVTPPQDIWYPPRIVEGRPRWGNQTDSGQNKLPPSKDRAKLRSQTYAGIAAAMAAQWGGVVTLELNNAA